MKLRALGLGLLTLSLIVTGCSQEDDDALNSLKVPAPAKTPAPNPTVPERVIPDDFEAAITDLKTTYATGQNWSVKGYWRSRYDYLDSQSDWQPVEFDVNNRGQFRLKTDQALIVSDGDKAMLQILIDDSFGIFDAPPSPTAQAFALNMPVAINLYRFMPSLEIFSIGLDTKKINWREDFSAFKFDATNMHDVHIIVDEDNKATQLEVEVDAVNFLLLITEQQPSPSLSEDLFKIEPPAGGFDVTDQFKSLVDSSAQDALINNTAPPINDKLITGENFSWEQTKGKVVIIDFWATWCPPCVDSLPELGAFAKTLDPEQVIVLGANLDFEEDIETRTIPFLEKHEIEFQQLAAKDKPWLDNYGVGPLPYMVIIGRDGDVIDYYLGAAPDKSVLQRIIDEEFAE